jgi:hypothetical protein
MIKTQTLRLALIALMQRYPSMSTFSLVRQRGIDTTSSRYTQPGTREESVARIIRDEISVASEDSGSNHVMCQLRLEKCVIPGFNYSYRNARRSKVQWTSTIVMEESLVCRMTRYGRI